MKTDKIFINSNFLFSLFLILTIGLIAGCKNHKTVSTAPTVEAKEAKIGEGGNQPDSVSSMEEKKEESQVKNIFWNQVAGMFYPSDPDELKDLISDFLTKAKVNEELKSKDLIGMISPHAGYVYSGSVAAWGYKQLQGRAIKTVIILGFSHRSFTPTSAILPYSSYKTPLGTVKVDTELARKLIEKGNGLLVESKVPFTGEHSMEVQIPFIQTVLPEASILPIAVAGSGNKIDEALSRLLYDTVGRRKDIFIVASTDLSHYTPYDVAVQTDNETLKLIEAMDLEKLLKYGPGANMLCGYYPVGVLLKLMSFYKPEDRKGKILKYANSGDTSGDKSRGVVGYGVVVFSLKEGVRTEGDTGEKTDTLIPSKQISESDKNLLYEIARRSIEDALLKREMEITPPESNFLKEKLGSIVVIQLNGRIYGTGKEISLSRPLYESVAISARNAAIDDARYPSPPVEKLSKLKIFVYVIYRVEKVETTDVNIELLQVNKATTGFILHSSEGEGIVLPGEPLENKWDQNDTLALACRRANLMYDCYKENKKKTGGLALTILEGAAI